MWRGEQEEEGDGEEGEEMKVRRLKQLRSKGQLKMRRNGRTAAIAITFRCQNRGCATGRQAKDVGRSQSADMKIDAK